MPANTANGKETAMADKYNEMAQQMRAGGVDEERAKDEFLRGCGTTDIEAARTWRGMPERCFVKQIFLAIITLLQTHELGHVGVEVLRHGADLVLLSEVE